MDEIVAILDDIATHFLIFGLALMIMLGSVVYGLDKIRDELKKMNKSD